MTKETPNTVGFDPQFFSQYIPHLSIDCVILGFHDNELKVLLSKFPNEDLWALQGGFIKKEEDIDTAAVRILNELTGLENIFLKQYQTFGKANRSEYKEAIEWAIEHYNYDFDNIPFLNERFISIGYFSLVDFQKVAPPGVDSYGAVSFFFERSEWHDIDKLPNLIYDHAEMIEQALNTMRQTLDYQLIGFNLMPEVFTMKELQRLYETILGEPLRRNNFQEKMLNLDILERLEKQYSGGAHKAPYLYRFKP